MLDFFFFFQAEDGIRDYKVTGVQTCALPIFRPEDERPLRDRDAPRRACEQRVELAPRVGERASARLRGRATRELRVERALRVRGRALVDAHIRERAAVEHDGPHRRGMAPEEGLR